MHLELTTPANSKIISCTFIWKCFSPFHFQLGHKVITLQRHLRSGYENVWWLSMYLPLRTPSDALSRAYLPWNLGRGWLHQILNTVFCLHQVLVLHKTLKWWGCPGGLPTSFWAAKGCLRKSPCPCSAGPLCGLACTLSNMNNRYHSISKKGFHGNLRQYICGLETIFKAYKICPPVNSNSKWEEKGGSMCHCLLFLFPKSISLLWGI